MHSLTHIFSGMPRALMFALLVLAVVLVLRKLLGGPATDPSTGQPTARNGKRRLCAGCATAHPSFAKYCRRCGKAL